MVFSIIWRCSKVVCRCFEGILKIFKDILNVKIFLKYFEEILNVLHEPLQGGWSKDSLINQVTVLQLFTQPLQGG